MSNSCCCPCFGTTKTCLPLGPHIAHALAVEASHATVRNHDMYVYVWWVKAVSADELGSPNPVKFRSVNAQVFAVARGDSQTLLNLVRPMRRTPPTEGPHARTVPTAAGKWASFWCEMLHPYVGRQRSPLKCTATSLNPSRDYLFMYLNCQEREGVYRRARKHPKLPLSQRDLFFPILLHV